MGKNWFWSTDCYPDPWVQNNLCFPEFSESTNISRSKLFSFNFEAWPLNFWNNIFHVFLYTKTCQVTNPGKCSFWGLMRGNRKTTLHTSIHFRNQLYRKDTPCQKTHRFHNFLSLPQKCGEDSQICRKIQADRFCGLICELPVSSRFFLNKTRSLRWECSRAPEEEPFHRVVIYELRDGPQPL